MTTWLIRRLFQALFVVIAMSVIVFIGVHVIGNPVDILISPEADQAESSPPSVSISRCGSNTHSLSTMRCTAIWAAASCSTNRH
jgi:ABC-type dipeptide/oligopeptide/nickel transport system permease component